MHALIRLGLLLTQLSHFAAGQDYHRRPWNVTGLNLEFYDSVGSYYNGTTEIVFSLKDRQIDEDESDGYPGKTCSQFVNRTVRVSYNGLAAFTRPHPAERGDYRMHVALDAWDSKFNLSDNNASDHQRFHFQNTDGEHLLWNLTATGNSSILYDFGGARTTEHRNFADIFYLNLTEQCHDQGSLSVYEVPSYLFSAFIFQPEDFEDDEPTWTSEFRTPYVSGHLGAEAAALYLRFDTSMLSQAGQTKLIGMVEVTFSGALDARRSDELLLGRDQPEWNATLGYVVTSVLEDQAARIRLPAAAAVYFPMGCMLLLMLLRV